MQEINLKDITLLQAGLTYNLPFYNTLKKYNIKTVYQLLYDDAMTNIIKNAQEQTRNELLGFIDLVKYKYLGTTLPMYTILDIKPRKNITLQGNEVIVYQCNFTRMGFNGRQECEIIELIKLLYANNFINEDTRLIDCFKKILVTDFGNSRLLKTQDTCKIINIYIETYDKLTKINVCKNEEADPIQELEEMLNNLILQRDEIDFQINDIKSRLDYLYEKKEKQKNR